MSKGEEMGWERLQEMDPRDVCARARAEYEKESKSYRLNSFGIDVTVSVTDRTISCPERDHDILSGSVWEYSGLTYVWYLVSAQEASLSGQLVRPDNLRGGHLFSKGTHVLPLKELAEKYDTAVEEFYGRAKLFNAESVKYGDAAIQLMPLPRIPVTVILWKGDDEFPARADFLFDSSCESCLPVDILWSTAMMSMLVMIS